MIQRNLYGSKPGQSVMAARSIKRCRFGLHLFALALAVPLLHGCPGEDVLHVEIQDAAIAPNPIPSPTAQNTTRFVLRFRSQGDNHVMSINLGTTPGAAPGTSGADTASNVDCVNGGCAAKDIEIPCTSSLNARDPNLRDLKCTQERDIVQTRTPGRYVFSFVAATIGGGVGIQSDSDTRDVQVDIQ